MGSCVSSHNHPKRPPSKTPSSSFVVTLAFPACSPISVTIGPNDKVSAIRKKAIKEMERRNEEGEPFCTIEGKLVTVENGTGDTIVLRDSVTVAEAGLEPKQYLWFQDQNEDARVQNILSRSARLTDNTSYNSRGVKQGMAMIKAEEETAEAY